MKDYKNYVIKTKITRPSDELVDVLNKTADIARFTYNWLLGYCLVNKVYPKNARDEFRRQVKKGAVYNYKENELYDEDFQTLLKSTPSQITDMESDNLIKAFKKSKKKLPKFKCKCYTKKSFTLNKKSDSNFRLDENGYLSIVKLGTIKLNLDKLKLRLVDYEIQRITISETSYGWYISIMIRIPPNMFYLKSNNKHVGIDWGIKAFASDSDGNQFRIQDQDCFKYYMRTYKRLKYLQSILGKKRENNNNWKTSKKYKALKAKIAHLYERLANMRKDFLNNISSYYIHNYKTIVIENLKPSNLLKNHKLARLISEGMFYTWKTMLSYKAELYNRILKIVNPVNTSQTCSKCGTVLETKLKLSQRVFKCSCGYIEDRDLNAAKNILALA